MHLNNVAIFGGFIGKYNMSKFLALCEKVQKTLNEAGEDPNAAPTAPTPPAPGEPEPTADTPGAPVIDPNTESEVKVVTNDQLKDFVAAMKDFYQSGNALSAEATEEINKLPSTAEDKDISTIVETLTRIFRDSKLPQDTSETEA
jgi:hypothetical protein